MGIFVHYDIDFQSSRRQHPCGLICSQEDSTKLEQCEVFARDSNIVKEVPETDKTVVVSN